MFLTISGISNKVNSVGNTFLSLFRTINKDTEAHEIYKSEKNKIP